MVHVIIFSGSTDGVKLQWVCIYIPGVKWSVGVEESPRKQSERTAGGHGVTSPTTATPPSYPPDDVMITSNITIKGNSPLTCEGPVSRNRCLVPEMVARSNMSRAFLATELQGLLHFL